MKESQLHSRLTVILNVHKRAHGTNRHGELRNLRGGSNTRSVEERERSPCLSCRQPDAIDSPRQWSRIRRREERIGTVSRPRMERRIYPVLQFI